MTPAPAPNIPPTPDDSALFEALASDVAYCERQWLADDTPASRRQLVRSLFSYIEGVTWALKQGILDAYEGGWIVLSLSEVATLREVAFDVDDRGVAGERPFSPRFAANILFTFKTHSRVFAPQPEPAVGNAGWQALRAAATIRNRLVHPKTVADLAVAEGELMGVRAGFDWYLDHVNRAHAAYATNLRAQSQAYEEGSKQIRALVSRLRAGEPMSFTEE